MQTHRHNGLTIVEIDPEGPVLSGEQGALDLLGESYGQEADLIAVPVARMAPASWTLSTRELGGFTQKLTNYRMRVAFIGDLAAPIAASNALRDYVRESNARKDVIFAVDRAELLRILG